MSGGTAYHKGQNRTCLICGEVFVTYSRGKYCSNKCRNEQRNRNYRLNHPIANRFDICLQCGKNFISHRKWQRFCSPECQGKYNHLKRRALGIRFAVLSRDNFTCQYCGRKAPDVILEVDHKKPRSKNGDTSFDNLITACKECNRGKHDCLIEQHKANASLKYYPH